MKMQNVPLSEIVPNPWRDMKLYPINKEHLAELKDSIKDHGFFGGIKGRRRNGKIELACGHSRIEAARKSNPPLNTVPIFVEDIDDDAMLRLMTDENALQSDNPGAVMNEVAAVTRRIIDRLLGDPDNCPDQIARLFKGKGMEQTRGRLRTGTDVHRTLGVDLIRAYLGQGNPDKAHRTERQIREAITTLKQSGRYDDLVDEAISKYPPPALPQPVETKPKQAKKKDVAPPKPKKARRRILDETCASLFPNEHQFAAFREVVTSAAGQEVIPVDNQYDVAQMIIKEITGGNELKKKGMTAPLIRKTVQHFIQQTMKQQRKINKEEEEEYLDENLEARIGAVVETANKSLRTLISMMGQLQDLAKEYPSHPKIGGFSAKLDMLVGAIQQFSRRIK